LWCVDSAEQLCSDNDMAKWSSLSDRIVEIQFVVSVHSRKQVLL